jgi:hypothetical protein
MTTERTHQDGRRGAKATVRVRRKRKRERGQNGRSGPVAGGAIGTGSHLALDAGVVQSTAVTAALRSVGGGRGAEAVGADDVVAVGVGCASGQRCGKEGGWRVDALAGKA